MQTTKTPTSRNRFEKVNLLNLLDPQWLENSQARNLVRMMREANAESQRVESEPRNQIKIFAAA